MTAKRHERTRARRAALQVLYTSEITEISPADIAERESYLSDDGVLSDYAEAIVRGVTEHREAIDGHLTATSENWSLVRMPIVDRSILRLATYEMLYVDDVPTSVAINEAVELAKDFGGEDESPRFVNGVLGRIAKRLEEDAAVSGSDPCQAAVVPQAADPCQAVAPQAADADADTELGSPASWKSPETEGTVVGEAAYDA